MPLYVYEVIEADGSGGEHFEVLQGMGEAPLSVDPESGRPVRRVPTAPSLPLRHGERAERARISDRNLSRLGFTKLVRTEKGYEKR